MDLFNVLLSLSWNSWTKDPPFSFCTEPCKLCSQSSCWGFSGPLTLIPGKLPGCTCRTVQVDSSFAFLSSLLFNFWAALCLALLTGNFSIWLLVWLVQSTVPFLFPSSETLMKCISLWAMLLPPPPGTHSHQSCEDCLSCPLPPQSEYSLYCLLLVTKISQMAKKRKETTPALPGKRFIDA